MRRKNNKDINKTITYIENVHKKIDDIACTMYDSKIYYDPVYSRTRFVYSDIMSCDLYMSVYNIFRDEV